MAPSVESILPRPFAEIDLNDVRALAAARDEPESAVLEFKSTAEPKAVAKACAAFANTLGGLFIAGIADTTEIVGIKRPDGEVQLWTKNVLRTRVLPTPAFEARWLAIDEDVGLLLILIRQSSTTPHLLSTGQIYVRNPGSSDPVPLNDQGRLFDLVKRGEQAREAAAERAGKALTFGNLRGTGAIVGQFFALSPTGVDAPFRDRLFSPRGGAQLIQAARDATDHHHEWTRLAYEQDSCEYRARWRDPATDPRHLRIVADGDGLLLLQIGPDAKVGPPAAIDARLTEAALWHTFERAVDALARLVTDLGAHGEARLAYSLLYPHAPLLEMDGQAGTAPLAGASIERWLPLPYSDPGYQIRDSVFAELRRAHGIGPLPS